MAGIYISWNSFGERSVSKQLVGYKTFMKSFRTSSLFPKSHQTGIELGFEQNILQFHKQDTLIHW